MKLASLLIVVFSASSSPLAAYAKSSSSTTTDDNEAVSSSLSSSSSLLRGAINAAFNSIMIEEGGQPCNPCDTRSSCPSAKPHCSCTGTTNNPWVCSTEDPATLQCTKDCPGATDGTMTADSNEEEDIMSE